jgi:hypothetical protein
MTLDIEYHNLLRITSYIRSIWHFHHRDPFGDTDCMHPVVPDFDVDPVPMV